MQLVEIGWVDDEIIIENVDEEFLPAKLDKAATEQEIGECLKSAYGKISSRHPLKCRSVSVTLPSRLFEIVELPVDDLLTKEDLTAHLNWEFSVLYPHKDPADFLLRYFETGINDYQNSKRILVAGIEKKILSAVHKFCTSSKLSLRLVDNVHFAANLLIRPEDNLKNYISLYSDDETLTMMIFEKGKAKFFRMFDSTHLVNLPDEIKAEFKKYYKNNTQNGLYPVYAAGESFNDETLDIYQKKLDVSVTRISPLGNLKASPMLFNKSLIVSKFYSFAAPIGIAARIS
jgi:Tfp pilus assembly PilM family ATPase